jgi:lipid A 3-O-deacylase
MTALLLLLMAWQPAPADSLRPTSPAHRLAFTFANDFFFGIDYYFTQGIVLDWVSPALARSPVNYLLPAGPVGSTRSHGIALYFNGFTPLDVRDARLRRGDRPYAAYIYTSLYRVGNQAARQQRLTTALEIGYLGPATGARAIQTKLHEITGYAPPRGWNYQVRSDLVLGYRAAFEKRVLAMGRSAELIGSAEASVGTLYTYARGGLRLRTGRFTPYFADLAPPGPGAGRRWQCYGEATLTAQAVGYDATLQGGVLNHGNPYVLSAGVIRRAVLRGSGGLVVAHGGLSFTATAVVIGPEFAGGLSHRWGAVGVGQVF